MQRASLIRTVFALLPVVGTPACRDQPLCVEAIDPAMVVMVRDALTRQPVTVTQRGVATTGGRTDSLVAIDDHLLALLTSDPGVYDVRIEAPGYVPWDTGGVEVQPLGGRCGSALTTRLTAPLRPAAP